MTCQFYGINYNLFWFYMYLVEAKLQRCSFAFFIVKISISYV